MNHKIKSEIGNNKIVHYDTCDLSSTFLHGVKLREPNHAAQSAP